MKYDALTGMSDEQLALTLRDTEKHLFQLRFQSATDRLETPSEIRKAKRSVARIKTVQRERELKRLGELPDADLAAQVTALSERVAGPGKRRVKRGLNRLAALQASRTAAAVGVPTNKATKRAANRPTPKTSPKRSRK